MGRHSQSTKTTATETAGSEHTSSRGRRASEVSNKLSPLRQRDVSRDSKAEELRAKRRAQRAAEKEKGSFHRRGSLSSAKTAPTTMGYSSTHGVEGHASFNDSFADAVRQINKKDRRHNQGRSLGRYRGHSSHGSPGQLGRSEGRGLGRSYSGGIAAEMVRRKTESDEKKLTGLFDLNASERSTTSNGSSRRVNRRHSNESTSASSMRSFSSRPKGGRMLPGRSRSMDMINHNNNNNRSTMDFSFSNSMLSPNELAEIEAAQQQRKAASKQSSKQDGDPFNANTFGGDGQNGGFAITFQNQDFQKFVSTKINDASSVGSRKSYGSRRSYGSRGAEAFDPFGDDESSHGSRKSFGSRGAEAFDPFGDD